jgi:hypothetical protein
MDEVVQPAEDIRERFHARLEAHRRQSAVKPQLLTSWLGQFPLLGWPRQVAAVGALAAFLVCGVYFGMYRISAPGPETIPAYTETL